VSEEMIAINAVTATDETLALAISVGNASHLSLRSLPKCVETNKIDLLAMEIPTPTTMHVYAGVLYIGDTLGLISSFQLYTR
jgi:hypothetical protein